MTADNLLLCSSLSSLSKPLCRTNNYTRQNAMPCSSLFAVSGAACVPMSRKQLEQLAEWSVISYPSNLPKFPRTHQQSVTRFSHLVPISCSACSVSYNCDKSIVSNVVWLLFMALLVTWTLKRPAIYEWKLGRIWKKAVVACPGTILAFRNKRSQSAQILPPHLPGQKISENLPE